MKQTSSIKETYTMYETRDTFTEQSKVDLTVTTHAKRTTQTS